MNFIKKHWLLGVHIIGVVAIFLDPSVTHYVATHPQVAGTVGFAWAELMRWLKSPAGGAQ